MTDQEIQKSEQHSVINQPKPGYKQPGIVPFAKGNPGRPKGALNHSTRVRNQLLACVGRPTLRLWKRALKDPKQLPKVIDQVIALVGPAKPLAVVDNSKRTYMTVVLDGHGHREQPEPGRVERL